MGVFFQAFRLFNHWLKTQSEHSAHSPALFKLYSGTILKDTVQPCHQAIEGYRKILLTNKSAVESSDFGSGILGYPASRTVSSIAATSLTPARWSRLLYRLLKYTKAKNILELGTCLGINSLYLSDNPEVKVWTIEGNPQLASLAAEFFSVNGRKNITLIQGEIDKHLEEVLGSMAFVDLSFMDANHRYQPTLKYGRTIWGKLSPGGMLIADDINRSPEMRNAWSELSQSEGCAAAIDLFRWGILVKAPSELTGNHTWSY